MIKTKILICACMLVISSSTISVSGALVTGLVADRFNLQSEKMYSGIGNFGDTIYVDDDNTVGPWDGTLEHPYQHIQDGIDHASPSDTVFVFSGNYYEHIRIDESIDLVGEDSETTIIDGSGWGTVISAYVEGIDISSFTVQNAGFIQRPFALHSAVYCGSNNINIHGNIIRNNNFAGLVILSDEGINIYENLIENNPFGLYLLGAENCKLFSNIIRKNRYGIVISGFNSTISNNDIRSSLTGLLSSESFNLSVIDNNFRLNIRHARFAEYQSSTTNWDGNYWGRPRILPKPIFGRAIEGSDLGKPLVVFDRHPAIIPNPI